VEERQPEHDGERGRTGDGKRWGPPRPDLDRRTALVALAGALVAMAATIATSGLSFTTDRYLLVLLVPALVIRRARRYLLDFIPFALLMLAYQECRGLAHSLRPHPYYLPQLDADKFLFGGHVPTVSLQHWLWHGHLQTFDRIVVGVTDIHFIVPPALAFILWTKRRALFYRFTATLLTLSFAGAITFLLYPAAPPWAAARHGFLPESVHRIGHAGHSSAHKSIFSLGKYIASNPFAAVPSLHGGYAFLAFLFVATLAWKTRWRWWAIGIGILYPLAQSFAVVYTANHYVIDLLIGFAYATAALVAVQWFWRRRGWPE
jgi:membrane-associated phospholipid phosphatase